MTKDEALKLAFEAGFSCGPGRDGLDNVKGTSVNLMRFVNLAQEQLERSYDRTVQWEQFLSSQRIEMSFQRERYADWQKQLNEGDQL